MLMRKHALRESAHLFLECSTKCNSHSLTLPMSRKCVLLEILDVRGLGDRRGFLGLANPSNCVLSNKTGTASPKALISPSNQMQGPGSEGILAVFYLFHLSGRCTEKVSKGCESGS